MAQPGESRAVNWERARAEVSKFRAVADNSGLVEVDARISPRVDREDLPALCDARRDATVGARTSAEQDLQALPIGRDPVTDERRASLFRQLGAIASFRGDMVAAAGHFQQRWIPRPIRFERLEVTWPASRSTQVFSQLPVNRTFVVTEGDGQIQIVTLPPAPLGEPSRD